MLRDYSARIGAGDRSFLLSFEATGDRDALFMAGRLVRVRIDALDLDDIVTVLRADGSVLREDTVERLARQAP